MAAFLAVALTVTVAGPAGAQTDGTTTTVQLSAPSASSTVPVTLPPTTVATEVLGAQETNSGELAVTGFDAATLAAVGLALLVAGGGLAVGAARSRSAPV